MDLFWAISTINPMTTAPTTFVISVSTGNAPLYGISCASALQNLLHKTADFAYDKFILLKKEFPYEIFIKSN